SGFHVRGKAGGIVGREPDDPLLGIAQPRRGRGPVRPLDPHRLRRRQERFTRRPPEVLEAKGRVEVPERLLGAGQVSALCHRRPAPLQTSPRIESRDPRSRRRRPFRPGATPGGRPAPRRGPASRRPSPPLRAPQPPLPAPRTPPPGPWWGHCPPACRRQGGTPRL